MNGILWRDDRRSEESESARKKRTLPRRGLSGVSGVAGSNEPLLDSKVCEDLRLLFIHNEQVVASGAILRDRGFAVFGGVIAVVTTEAARIVHVADVIRMRSPGDFHVGENILAVEDKKLLPSGLYEIALRSQDFRMIGLVEGL